MSNLEKIVHGNHDELTKRELLFQMAPVVGILRGVYTSYKVRPDILDEPFMKKYTGILTYGVYQGLSVVGAGFLGVYLYKLIEKLVS